MSSQRSSLPPVSQRTSLPPVSQPISLPTIIQQRGVVLFSLDRASNGPVADIIANLVARDIAGSFTGRRLAGTGGDGLAWFSQCETADPQALAGLVAAGTGAGLATVLSTTSAATTGRLAGQAGVLVVHQLTDRTLASQLAGLAGQQLVPVGPGPTGRVTAGPLDAAPAPAALPPTALPPTAVPLAAPAPATPAVAAPPGAYWAPVVTGEALCARPAGEFLLIRPGGPVGAMTRAVSVPARIRGRRQPRAAGRSADHPGRAGPLPGRPADQSRWAGPRAGQSQPADHSQPAEPPARTVPGDEQAEPLPAVAPPGPADFPLAGARPGATPAGPADSSLAGTRPGATPSAVPGVPPWPNAPAWACGQLPQDQPQ